MNVQEGAFDSDGVRIHYFDWGGDGPPLILIHATGFLAALWRPIAEELAERFRVIAVDQRGHGDSDKPEHGYSFDAFAADTQRLIEELGLERPVAVGHSSGGTTIVVHASRHPSVIRRCVLIEPILPRPDWYATGAPRRNPFKLAEGARKRRAVWESREEMYRSYRSRPTFAHWREDVLRLYAEEGTFDRDDGQVELKCPPHIEAQFFEAVTQVDAWPELDKFEMPTLALWGERSHLLERGLADRLGQALPNVRTVMVDDAGHLLPQERPDEVARLIGEFLSD